MIKYEVITQYGRPAVHILDIGNIRRGCGSVYVGKYGSIRSEQCTAYYDHAKSVYIHGTSRDMDDCCITPVDITNVTKILDEYNKELA